METLRVLARKDAYSIIVAVTLGLMVQGLLYSIAYQISLRLTEPKESDAFSFSSPTGDWRRDFLLPLLTFAFSFVALEVMLQIIRYAKAKPTGKGKR